ERRAADLERAHRETRAQQRAAPRSREAKRQERRGERDAGRARQHRNAACSATMASARSGEGASVRRSTGALTSSKAQEQRARTSVPLVPPKPNELESATRIGILRAAFGT